MEELVSLSAKLTRPLDVEAAVRARYAAAAQQPEAALCCPVRYDPRYLEVLPAELLERDYGCGDPSRHVRPGERVLDLGSGGGKICYIAAQIVGPQGAVLGVDANDEMLALARKYQQPIAERLGYANVEFRRGRIQDLGLDLDRFDAWLAAHPVRTAADWNDAEQARAELRRTAPLAADASFDVVLSNCVLNLVQHADREQLFRELFRVLRPGGRAVISDIVCDRPVPPAMQHDPRLWSGCLSGAFVEEAFWQAFAAAGFSGLELLDRQCAAWQTIAGIEFRSLTLQAYKPTPAVGDAAPATVIYRGPWQSVTDDAGRTLLRGARTAVAGAEAARYAEEPYARDVASASAGPAAAAGEACCGPTCCP